MPATKSPSVIQHRLLDLLEQREIDHFLTLIDGTGQASSLSYGELVSEGRRWATLYRSFGLTATDRVLVVLKHSRGLYTSYLGAVLAGFIPAMMHFPSEKLSGEDYFEVVRNVVARIRPRLLVTYEELMAPLSRALGGGDRVRVVSEDAVQGVSEEADPNDPGHDDALAFLQLSSGTTGLKKVVGITHRQLLWQIDTYAASLAVTERDCVVSWLPLYHDMGLIACFWLPILQGTKLVAMSPFDWVRKPGMLLEAITHHRGTLCWMPNFAFNLVASRLPLDTQHLDLTSLRRGSCPSLRPRVTSVSPKAS